MDEGRPGPDGYDNTHNEIGKIARADALPPDRLAVRSRQRYVLKVTPGKVDDNQVTFKYGAHSWMDADIAHQCKLGGDENGYRDGLLYVLKVALGNVNNDPVTLKDEARKWAKKCG